MKSYIKYAMASTIALAPLTGNAEAFRFGPPATDVVKAQAAPVGIVGTQTPSPLVPANTTVSPNPQLSSQPFQVVGDVLDPNAKATPAREPEPFIDFNESDLTYDNWMTRYFKLIVVINKAPSAAKTGTPITPRPAGPQTITLYQKNADGSMQMILNRPISSGRDHFEGISETTGRHDSEGFSQTHTGYFRPTELHIDHRSGAYTHEDSNGTKQGSLMKFSAFFNKNEGEAIHQVPGGSEGMLGHRASGGCVREDAATAEYIYWRIRYTGGPLEEGTCYSDETGTEFVEVGNPIFQQAYAIQQSKQGWGPLPAKGSAWPQAPRMKPDGTGMVGKINDQGQFEPEMKNGYPVLFVVFYKKDNQQDPRDMEQVTLQQTNGTYIVADNNMWIDAQPSQPPRILEGGPTGGGTIQTQTLVGSGPGAACVVDESQRRRIRQLNTAGFNGYSYEVNGLKCLESDMGIYYYKTGRQGGRDLYDIIPTSMVFGSMSAPNEGQLMPGFQNGVTDNGAYNGGNQQATTVQKEVAVTGTPGAACMNLDQAYDDNPIKGSRHYWVGEQECLLYKSDGKVYYRVNGGWLPVKTTYTSVTTYSNGNGNTPVPPADIGGFSNPFDNIFGGGEQPVQQAPQHTGPCYLFDRIQGKCQ